MTGPLFDVGTIDPRTAAIACVCLAIGLLVALACRRDGAGFS